MHAGREVHTGRCELVGGPGGWGRSGLLAKGLKGLAPEIPDPKIFFMQTIAFFFFFGKQEASKSGGGSLMGSVWDRSGAEASDADVGSVLPGEPGVRMRAGDASLLRAIANVLRTDPDPGGADAIGGRGFTQSAGCFGAKGTPK